MVASGVSWSLPPTCQTPALDRNATTVSSKRDLTIDPPPQGAADARLQDFPECTTLRSHRRHFNRVHPRAPTLFAPHSQPCRSTLTPLTLISPLSGGGGPQVNPLPSLFMTSFLQRRRTSFHSLLRFAAPSKGSRTFSAYLEQILYFVHKRFPLLLLAHLVSRRHCSTVPRTSCCLCVDYLAIVVNV